MVVTITSDFGYRDCYTALIKGAIHTIDPNVPIVDISHGISPYNIIETAYILGSTYKSFPKGSIHLICVDREINQNQRLIVAFLHGHYFISSDNGVVSILEKDLQPKYVMQVILEDLGSLKNVFLGPFIYAYQMIKNGHDIQSFSKPFGAYLKFSSMQPFIEPGKINGSIIYIDHYGNVVTNITKEIFEENRKDRDFRISLRGIDIFNIYDSYAHFTDSLGSQNVKAYEGEIVPIFNTSGYIEIGMYRSNMDTVGGISTLFGLEVRDTISIFFT